MKENGSQIFLATDGWMLSENTPERVKKSILGGRIVGKQEYWIGVGG